MTTARSAFSAIGPIGRRPAHRRDPRRRHRHRRAPASARSRAIGAESHSACGPRCRAAFADAPYCTYASEAAEHEAFAHVAARGARRADAGRPGSRGIHPGAAQVDDDARSGPHARPHAQLPRVDGLHARRSSPIREFTRENGIAGSVMEYNAVNIALPGEKQGEYHMSTLGPVRLLGHRVRLPGIRAGAGSGGARAHRRALATSRSSRSWPTTRSIYSGLDPRANTFDLGADPLAYAERQLKLGARAVAAHRVALAAAGRELRAPAPQLLARPVRSPAERACRRSSTSAASRCARITRAAAARRSSRSRRRSSARRSSCSPTTIFAADSFRFPPSFLRRLAVSDFDIDDARDLGRSVPTVDIAVDQQVLAVQRVGAGAADRARRSRSACSTTSSRSPIRAQALQPGGALRDAARGHLQRVEDRRGHSAHPPQPAARVRGARRRRRCSVRRRRCPPMRARCCAPTRRQLRDELAAAQKRPKALAGNARARGGEPGHARRRAEGAAGAAGAVALMATAPVPTVGDARAARQPRARQPVRPARREPAPDRGRARRRDHPSRRRVHRRRRARAGARAPSKRCSASTPRRKSRCRSTTSSSGLVEIATQPQAPARAPEPPTTARRTCARAAPTCTAARRTRSSISRTSRPRHHVRHRSRGHRQDLPRRGLRGRRARARRGQAHRARASRGRGRRAAGLPARRPRAEGRSVPASALRRAVRPHGLRQGGEALRAHDDRAGAARLHARAHAQPFVHHPRRGAEHHARADEDVPDPHRLRHQGGDHRRRHADRPGARPEERPHRSRRASWPACAASRSAISRAPTSCAIRWCRRSSTPTTARPPSAAPAARPRR